MGDTRNIYMEPKDRYVIRTSDVYQDELDDSIAGYSETLLSLVANCSNAGAPQGFNAQAMVGKSKRGEVALRMFAVIDPESRRILQAGFKTRGCLAMTACASAVCQMIEGLTLDEALRITPDDVRESVDGVPWDKEHTPVFAAECVRALVGDWMIRNGAALFELDAKLPCNEDSIICIMCEHCSMRDARVELLVQEHLAKNEDEHTEDARSTADDQTPGDDAPSPESREHLLQEIAAHNALADVFADVAQASSQSQLSTPARWEGLGLVPEHMSTEDLEMAVYDYLDAWQKENNATGNNDEAFFTSNPLATPESKKQQRESAYASRPVGIPAFQKQHGIIRPPGDDEAPEGQSEEAQTPAKAASSLEDVALPSEESPDKGADAAVTNNAESDPFSALSVPPGYKLVEMDDEIVLVQVDPNALPAKKPIHCENVRMLMGKHGYYLYDCTKMTNAYARWSFLARESDPLITFVYCVREESRTYPRPMLATSLQNEPFHMNEKELARLFEQAQSSPDYQDVSCTRASNGDIYYYSTDYLSDTQASSLAEWRSVEKLRNV